MALGTADMSKEHAFVVLVHHDAFLPDAEAPHDVSIMIKAGGMDSS